jgi:imidazolonepropionase-like amidohydrolase
MNAREFSLMASNGFTPAQALLAGTAGGADLLGLADRIGTLQAGKDADIVAVAGNRWPASTRPNILFSL